MQRQGQEKAPTENLQFWKIGKGPIQQNAEL